MKSWKKRWKDELDEITPALREDVTNAPIPVTENINNNGGNTAALSVDKRKAIPIIAAITALLICAVILCVCLIKPSKTYNDFLFTLEINPAVTISTDENGIVNGVIASNADADVILADENVRSQIKGKSIETAVTCYTDYAAQLGYIDLEQSSAVRISGLGNDELLEKAKTSLENYFIGKGVFAAVVAESVSKEEFSLRSGISAELSAADITKFIISSNVLFSDRKAEDLSLQDLQSLYNELVVADKLFDYITESLSGNIERIIKNAEDIQNLLQLYSKIPGAGMDEIAELMNEIQTARENYKAAYGVEITGIAQLTAAAESYAKIPFTLLENLSLENFKELSSDITEILEITGLVTSDFAGYLKAPQSLAEYVEKTTALLNSEYNSRLEKFENLYNKYRPPVEKTDYETFIQNIVQKYGSLNQYWEAVKK